MASDDIDPITGKHEFSWAVMPHQGHFLESDVPIAATLFNSPIHGETARVSCEMMSSH